MSNRYEVSIRSKLKNPLLKVIKSGKIYDWQNGERIIINDPDEYLEIFPPEGEDIKFCLVSIQSIINVILECAVEEGKWKIHFPRSKSKGADSPTTVNVTVAPPEGNGP